LLGIEVLCQLIGTTHIAVELEIVIDVTYAKMMAQVTHEHVSCSRFINLFLLAEQGKQA
jgi:hypothetical protein